jgi:predicted ATPase
MSSFTVRATNFRVFDKFEWSPSGVCLLGGPNGSGKTTSLDVLRFLRAVFLHGHEAAFGSINGSYFRRTGTPQEEPVTFEFEIGDILWRLRFPMFTSGLRGQYGEELYRAGEKILHADMFDQGWYLGTERRERFDDRRCCAKVLWDTGTAAWLNPLEAALANMRIHETYDLGRVRAHEAATGVDSVLHGTGKNLWSVLSNWSQAPIKQGGKFQWVLNQARAAFPGLIGSIEFDRGLPFLFGPNVSDPADGLPPSRQADGLLTGLLHLTAIAGAPDGALLAFDEVENQLHPHAIHTLLEAMRQQADERDLTIILTTHSPVVMNAFKGYEDQFYVLSRSSAPDPVPRQLDELYNEDWLAHFVLGDLYEREMIVAPNVQGSGSQEAVE